MAAQFHRDALHVASRQGSQLFAHRGGAGEGDLADHRVRDQITGNLGGRAKHQAEYALGDAGIDEAIEQGCRGSGRLFRRLHQE
ncbi:hypothetical protein D3C85_1403730 [compost metagenome]